MCWNAEVSVGSFGIICAVSYLLWRRNQPNDRVLGLFIFSYGLMQFFEFLMWMGQTPEGRYINRAGSLGAAILLYAHPLAFFSGLAYDKGYPGITTSPLFQGLFAASVATLLYGTHRTINEYQRGTRSFLSYPDSKSGHLVWEFPDNYQFIMLLILLGSIAIVAPRYLTAFALLSLFFLGPALIMKKTMNVSSENAGKNYVGSYWCWWVATFSFAVFFLH